MKVKNMPEAWSQYIQCCYPDGVTAEQERQFKQAFLAGALVMAGQMAKAAELGDSEAVKRVAELLEQLKDMTNDHLHAHGQGVVDDLDN